ncbi:hypothetical protein CCP3SC15_210013 [Gammaproteobacteria bacterium]
MSIKIPVYQQKVGINTPPQAAPVAAAFGGDVAEAAAKQGQAITQLADKIAEHATKWQESINQKNVLDADTKFRLEMQNTLYSPETDTSGKPKGIYNRQLSQAAGASTDFDNSFKEVAKKYQDGLDNPLQQEMFKKLSDNYYITERDQVDRHEATQTRASFGESLNANINQRVADVTKLADPAAIDKVVEDTVSVAAGGLRHNGTDENTINYTTQKLAGDMAEKSVASLLDKNYTLAQSVFEKLKPRLSGESIASIDKMLKGKEQLVKAQSTWNTLKGITDSDGLPDTPAILAKVDAMNLQPAEKEQIADYVKSKAGETTQLIHQQRAANDRDFMNDLYTAKKNGASLDDALKLVGQYGRDAYDQGVKRDAIKGLYSNPKETNPVAYMNLWTGVQDGTATEKQVDNEMRLGNISASDWEGLRKEMYRIQKEGSTPAVKEAWARVKILADQKLTNKEDNASFIYVLHQETQGKTPEEIFKIANDKLKDDPRSGWIFKNKQWQTDLKQLDAQNTAWGKMYQDLSRDVVLEIGKGALAGGAKTWGIDTVSQFADKFGGYEKIKPGTPVNDAMQYLTRNHELVTPANVTAVMQYFKTNPEAKK